MKELALGNDIVVVIDEKVSFQLLLDIMDAQDKGQSVLLKTVIAGIVKSVSAAGVEQQDKMAFLLGLDAKVIMPLLNEVAKVTSLATEGLSTEEKKGSGVLPEQLSTVTTPNSQGITG